MQIRLNENIDLPLEKLAKNLQCSKQQLVAQAIEDFLQRQKQEAYRAQDTLVALAEAESGQVIDGDAVLNWIASWGSDNELPSPR